MSCSATSKGASLWTEWQQTRKGKAVVLSFAVCVGHRPDVEAEHWVVRKSQNVPCGGAERNMGVNPRWNPAPGEARGRGRRGRTSIHVQRGVKPGLPSVRPADCVGHRLIDRLRLLEGAQPEVIRAI